MHKNAPLTAPGEPKFSAFYQTVSLKNQVELILQALWQIYLPKHIPLPKFDVFTPNTKQTLFFFYTTLWGMVGPKKRVTPQRCRNAAARGPKIFRMGRLASCCGLFSEREVTRSRAKTRCGHQRKGRLFQALHPSSQIFSPVRDMTPLRGGCVLSLPARRAWGRKQKKPQIRSGLLKCTTS